MSNPCPECSLSGSVQCQPHKCQDLLDWQDLNRYSDVPQKPSVKSYKCNLCRKFKASIHFDLKPDGKPMSICIECHKNLNKDLDEVEQLAKKRKPKPIPPKVEKKEPVKTMAETAKEPTNTVSLHDKIIEEIFTGYPDAFEALKARAKNSVRTTQEQIVFESKCLAEGLELFDPATCDGRKLS